MIFLAVLVFIASESEKVRPEGPVPLHVAAPRLSLVAAGGECVGAQLVVRGPVAQLSATASEGLELSRVAFIQLDKPSGPDGATGEWPDALIPARDAIYGEPRNAFPTDVPQGRSQPIFVEWCAPAGKGPSRSQGVVHLSFGLDVPVELRARPFDLPIALATAFGFSGYSAAKGHGLSPDAAPELTRAYDRLALHRGITLMGGMQDPPPWREGKIDWRAYDAETGPFIAQWSALDAREPRKLSREARREYRRQYVQHAREHGFLDKLFRYVADEPARKDFAKVEDQAREYAADAPGIRRLVTTALSPDLPDVNLFTPVLNCVGEKDLTCPRAVPRDAYAQPLWWYQSCLSHGCSETGEPVRDPAFSGWPSYMIDAPATAARAMGALAYVNRISGELYFDTVYIYDSADPWKTQWAFGGNGDGTLYYPGKPKLIGGKRDVPIESLRLVNIARGLADHAYLSLCARLGDPRLALELARSVAPSRKGFSRDPAQYVAMREALAARIEALQKQAP